MVVNNSTEVPVKSRPEKLRKKDDKSVEHVLKALNSLDTTEEKLAAMCKKYADIFDENRKLQVGVIFYSYKEIMNYIIAVCIMSIMLFE